MQKIAVRMSLLHVSVLHIENSVSSEEFCHCCYKLL